MEMFGWMTHPAKSLPKQSTGQICRNCYNCKAELLFSQDAAMCNMIKAKISPAFNQSAEIVSLRQRSAAGDAGKRQQEERGSSQILEWLFCTSRQEELLQFPESSSVAQHTRLLPPRTLSHNGGSLQLLCAGLLPDGDISLAVFFCAQPSCRSPGPRERRAPSITQAGEASTELRADL